MAKDSKSGSDSKSGAEKRAKNQQQEDENVAAQGGEPLDGRVIRADEDVDAKNLGNKEGIAEENVYEEFYPEGSKRPSYRLVVAKGTPVEDSLRQFNIPMLSDNIAHAVPAEQGYEAQREDENEGK